MSYKDRYIDCVDCGDEFVFTVSEQEFNESKGFTNDPKRCKPCRQARKAGGGGGSRGGPRPGGGGGGGGRPSGGRPGGGGRGGDREMFDAVCAACGQDTKVPFRPSPNRDVFCSDCFRSQRDSGGGRGRGDRW
ncbi:MAG: zinc-ribbon domain containing protein [Vulcanimicrobiota bacterium]